MICFFILFLFQARALDCYLRIEKKKLVTHEMEFERRSCREQDSSLLDCGIWSCIFAEVLRKDDEMFSARVEDKKVPTSEFRARIVTELLLFGYNE